MFFNKKPDKIGALTKVLDLHMRDITNRIADIAKQNELIFQRLNEIESRRTKKD